MRSAAYAGQGDAARWNNATETAWTQPQAAVNLAAQNLEPQEQIAAAERIALARMPNGNPAARRHEARGGRTDADPRLDGQGGTKLGRVSVGTAVPGLPRLATRRTTTIVRLAAFTGTGTGTHSVTCRTSQPLA